MSDQPHPRRSPSDGTSQESGRREFVKRLAYVAPVILTLPAKPAWAQNGSRPPPPQCQTYYFPVWDPNAGVWSCQS
jgi:hypothetical protein